MLAVMSSGPGDGDDPWITELTERIKELTHELSEVTGNIEFTREPAKEDVQRSLDLVIQLLELVKKNIIPRKAQLMRRTSSRRAQNLARELGHLGRSGQNARSAVNVYYKTIDNESLHQSSGLRSNTNFSEDQQSLESRRTDATASISELLASAQAFMRYLASPDSSP